jgi:hypothetical protein
MQNPWKLTTLILAGGLLISNARADSDWKKDALGHLEKAAAILEEHGGSRTGKTHPEDKKEAATPASKALQLTRAAIIQMKRTGGE